MVFYSHGCDLGAYGSGFFCYRYRNGYNCIDRYGHSEGDALIDKMSGILHEFMHDGCRVYRVGGDEFVMIMDNAGDEQAKDMVAAVRKRMSEVRTENAFRISSAVGCSCGKGRNEFIFF